jgi:hypothetical protein
MGLKTKIRNALKRPTKKEAAIIRHDDALAKFLQLGITPEQIVDKINAFDWLDLQEAKSENELAAITLRFYESFSIESPPAFRGIILKAFTHKFVEAIKYVREAIEHVNASYNIEGSSKGFQNDVVNKFYYISYWADKKAIPVNFNEKRQEKRELFNLDTIILSILADKLNAFNEYERNKPKKK